MDEAEGPNLHIIASDHTEQATESLTTNKTISKDNTEASKEQVLLFVKRVGDSEDGQDALNSPVASAEADELPRAKEAGHDDYIIPLKEEADNDAGQDTSEAAIISKPADVLHTQIREKLASIPELSLPDDSPHSQLIEYLTASMAKLSVENRMLEEALIAAKQSHPVDNTGVQAQDAENTNGQDKPDQPAFEEVHMVRCASSNSTYFRDAPRMFKGDLKSDHLRGLHELENMSTYLANHKQLAFVVVHHYKCRCAGGKDLHRQIGFKGGKMLEDSQPPEPDMKHIVCSRNVAAAIRDIAKAHPGPFEGWEMAKLPRWSYEPHFLFYVHHKAFVELADSSNLDEFDSQCIKLLCSWVLDNCKEDWDEADSLFARGKITAKHFDKLFRPGELVIQQLNHGIAQVHKVAPYPWTYEHDSTMTCYNWSFNGLFAKRQFFVDLSNMRSPSGSAIRPEDEEVDITSISVHPLRFSKPDVYDYLLARGSKFWSCRKKRIIAYHDPDLDGEDGTKGLAERRFMVDYKIFKRMHPRNSAFSSQVDDLGTEAMNKKEPPDDHFLALLPPQIHAFDFSTKSWKFIDVDRITDVTWNKDAFKRLVLPTETKELIQAAVMAQGQLLSASPDIIAGKGQGLLILLHGGPGTGKTLTAESIAETQERPLYRVTCGDIGIEPTDVERYLESVFTIGKAWGCVVLLDEADVFLEERTVSDQKQNAIVSIFLRLLEYYDGILILTTNRVGTFDEAFKSRIHLALRYYKLNQEQRVEIWRNLLGKLQDRSRERADMLKDCTKELIDINDLLMNVDKLARWELNGRQIRNVITMARYLAKFRGEILVYRHVQDALAPVVKFDEYLLELRGSDDHFATEQKIR
ncbi:hypothetical protein C8A01DRAFT_35852 [Parachaetomium inaequale]|uniref:AAA+ ATPase domain-containing protein n=1 Tax=Parachaetomium inaequale TaxID=2588326 RepID=A0AAN6PFP9_9PEZI|nr:hypothetical protein C8A01DRAFT_35852 [Parachaetomium inaequale]